MPPLVCRGCANQLSACNAGVDIFGQGTSSGLRKGDNSIKRGIELITGLAVSSTDGLPGRLCTDCNGKLEGFLAFRTQLLTSLRVFLSPGHSSAKSDQPPDAISLPSLSTARNNSIATPAPELNRDIKTELASSDRENKNRVGSTAGVDRCKGSNNINAIDEDPESEIDVCSGEDDGVLELDVQSKKDEIYEIESSDESDIQVCDYEPHRL